MKRDAALEPDRVAEIDARPETHPAAASCCSRRNRLINRRRVECCTVADRPKRSDIEGRKLIACERERAARARRRAARRRRRTPRRHQPGGGYAQKLSSANVHAWSRASCL